MPLLEGTIRTLSGGNIWHYIPRSLGRSSEQNKAWLFRKRRTTRAHFSPFITSKKNVRLPPLITGKGYFLAIDDDKKTTEWIGAYSADILWVKSLAGTQIQTHDLPTVYLALASNPSLAYFWSPQLAATSGHQYPGESFSRHHLSTLTRGKAFPRACTSS